MPNHVTARIKLTGDVEQIQQFRKNSIIADINNDIKVVNFDFNTIIPMPEILIVSEESSAAEEGASLLLLCNESAPYATGGLYDYKVAQIRNEMQMPADHINKVAQAYLKKHPDIEKLGKLRLEAIAQTGFASWYQWSKANWGTKWNSYDFEQVNEDPFEFLFITAWSFPQPIFEKLATIYPKVHFHCAAFDEGWNFACLGYFNPPPGEPEFAECEATNAMYKLVYSYEYEQE